MSRTGDERLWTVPNVFSGVRLLGVLPLLWFAWRGDRSLFVWLLVFLILTDWIDGKLAIVLDQQTEWGARMDSAADALMYGAIALSFWWLEPELILGELAWLAGALGSWGLSALVGLVRFGRMPSYHTRAAKLGWLVAGAVALFTIWSGNGAGVRWALALVVVTNVEAIAIGLLLPEWRANVPSVFQAFRIRRESEAP